MTVAKPRPPSALAITGRLVRLVFATGLVATLPLAPLAHAAGVEPPAGPAMHDMGMGMGEMGMGGMGGAMGAHGGGHDREPPPGIETSDMLAALLDRLASAESPDRDGEGFPVRRGVVSALDLSPAAEAKLEAAGFRVLERQTLPALGHAVVRLAAPQGMKLPAALAAVRAADPDKAVDFVHYYGLDLTAGGKAHRVSTGAPAHRPGEALAIGMIDTAIIAHPALSTAHIVPWAAGQQPGAPAGHGTAIASIIAEQGEPTIYSANIFRGTPERPFTSADVVADALEWLLSQNVAVINMSLAGPRNAVLDRLIGEAIARGRTIVAAAGNGGPTAPAAYPAAIPGVIAVTAVDRDLHVYRYANHGPYVAFAATGVDIVAANVPGGLARFTGTSFATAHVATLFARCRAGGATTGACEQSLARTARDLGPPGRDPIYGYGFVD